MIKKMSASKKAKFILVIIVCVITIYLLDAVLLDLSFDLIKMVRDLLPLKGWTAIICMYLISLVSISIVAFVSGLFSWISFNMISTGVISFIILDWLMSIKHYVFKISKVPGYFTFSTPTVMTVSSALLLLLALITLKSLHKVGKALRGKIRQSIKTTENISQQ